MTFPDEYELTRDLVARHGRGHTPYGLYLLGSEDPAADLCREIEREVFSEVFGNTPELMAAEYGRFEATSLFLLVVDHEQLRPAGTIRIITPLVGGGKTVEDVQRVWGQEIDNTVPDLELVLGNQTWDIATLAVARDYRGSRTNGVVSAALYQGVTMTTSRNGVRWVTATLDLLVLDLIQTQCCEPFSAFHNVEPRRYLDSPASLPVYCEVFEFQVLLELNDPVTYAFLFEGVGFEAFVSTPEWSLDRQTGHLDRV